MTDILLIIFTALLIFFIFRFVKIMKTARQNMQNEKAAQNIDLTTQLNAELDSDIESKADIKE